MYIPYITHSVSLFHTACGIANCVRCVRNPNRCTVCLRDTVLFVDEHGETECFACPLAEIAHKANLQEEKLHEEEEEQRERTIARTLCVSRVKAVIISVQPLISGQLLCCIGKIQS